MRFPRIHLDFSIHIGDDTSDDERYNDSIGTHHQTGFTTEREGRIGDVQ